MSDFVKLFEDRLQEIETYLDFLTALENQIKAGPPKIGTPGIIITVPQQRILYSSVYLQLYNLIESTITGCIDGITEAITQNGSWQPGDLSLELRGEWVRFIARTHTDLNYPNRLKHALELCEHLVQTFPISSFKVEKGAGGSWDVNLINDISERLGVTLDISKGVYQAIKKPFREDKAPLEYIKKLRNDLAHGSMSFVECSENVTVSDLRNLKKLTEDYLREVVNIFKQYIDDGKFLLPHRRPTSSGPIP